MRIPKLDFSPRGRARVYLLTFLGTLFCIVVATAYDSYDWTTGEWHEGNRPINNVVLPVMLGVPFFFILLSKMRQLAIAQHELISLASTDVLTSCLNRRAFTAIVETYLDRMENRTKQQKPQPRQDGALMIADIDNFKTINDRYGHEAGDRALQMVARTIREAVREPDLVGRIGGEEFGIFLPAADASHASTIGERVRSAVAAVDFRPQGDRHPITISIGGALFHAGAHFNDLYKFADRRLYEAKNNGRNRTDIEPLAVEGAAAPLPA